jgi:hypothetical protein
LDASHPDPAAVTTASDIVDRTLRLDADCQGKEVQEGLRYLIVGPLRVLFEVWPEDRHARVLRVLKQPRTSRIGTAIQNPAVSAKKAHGWSSVGFGWLLIAFRQECFPRIGFA